MLGNILVIGSGNALVVFVTCCAGELLHIAEIVFAIVVVALTSIFMISFKIIILLVLTIDMEGLLGMRLAVA